MTASDHPVVLVRVSRGLGWITLNRPRAINALNREMVARIDAQLAAWADDEDVAAVVLTGAGERGLCAGGDIVSIYQDARSGGRGSVEFWREEYVLNARIADYPKPYLAVMDGIVMGGGVGLSAHGGLRIVTDTTTLALPETGIGFCPDVGADWLLARAPGEIGTHLALTGDRIGAGDAIACGLADHYLPSSDISGFLGGLTAETISTATTALPRSAAGALLPARRSWIDSCYRPDSVAEIVRALRAHPDPEAGAAADRIGRQSPLALTVTLQALRRARRLPTLRDVLDQDLRISTAALDTHDLAEGIRAQVIDKDRSPHWSPATLEELTPDMIDRFFAAEPTGTAAR